MGLFSFLSSVGKKLSGASEAEAPNAETLKQELDSHKIGAEKVAVNVEGDKVVLQGEVKDQTALEKIVLALGNVVGVSGVNTDGLKIDVAEEESVFYTVKSGDNLWKIAEAHYGKGQGAKHELIFEANKPMLTHPDKIYPGQVLRIPPLKK